MARKLSQKKIKNRILELQILKRNGIMRTVAAFSVMTVLIIIFLTLKSQGNPVAESQYGSLTIFLLAVVAAGFAGSGTRQWKRASDELKNLQNNLK